TETNYDRYQSSIIQANGTPDEIWEENLSTIILKYLQYDDGRLFVFNRTNISLDLCRIEITNPDYRFGWMKIGIGTSKNVVEFAYRNSYRGLYQDELNKKRYHVEDGNCDIAFYYDHEGKVSKIILGDAEVFHGLNGWKKQYFQAKEIENMRNKFYIKLAFVFLAVMIIFLYPFYVRWITRRYAKQFAVVFNAHDIKQYDKFFSDNTIFDINGEPIRYSDVRENIQKMQNFHSSYSNGHLSEDTKVFTDNNYIVSLMLPITDYSDESGMRHFMLEGEFVLQRKWFFFFDITEVMFYDEQEKFLS
ncbi:MAG: hypothetical protein K2M91_01275, partial [Lachnospiraceae bacterium]|nr:hypothetical protein [Lachnospiraceae bacterium]